MDSPDNEAPSLQFLKKEITPTCVSNIHLKKVLYHTTPEDDSHKFTGISSSKFYQNTPIYENHESKAHLQWKMETVRTILHGTLAELINAVAGDDGEIDSTHVNVFLNTYRPYASTSEVLEVIQNRYKELGEDRKMKQDVKEAHQRTIRMLLLLWLDNFPEDFRDTPDFQCLHQLRAYVETYMPHSELAERVSARLQQFKLEEEQEAELDIVTSEDICSPLQLLNLDCTRPADCLARPLNFTSIPDDVFAQQLTYMDAELFKKVVPHHCMGSVWSGRDKKRNRAPSVYATVDQFNAVSYRVIATVLKMPELRPAQRAETIEKWIAIAQELRVLKNFSSLKAIVSGLQSNSVYRLRRVWEAVPREKMVIFDELSDIFSDHLNHMMCRELLMKEGTAKFADPTSTNTIRGQLGQRKKGTTTWTLRRKSMFEMPSVVHGTVPYLGTFLTDLTMVDAALDDRVAGGLINFEKRRKEFEIIAQIRLLQSAAQLYNIEPQHAFFDWFYAIRVYDDKESYELSCEIEPVTQHTPQEVKGHRKKSSLGFFSPRRPIYTTDDPNDPLAPNSSMPCILINNSPQRSPPPGSVPVSPAKQHRELLSHSHSVGCMRSDSKLSNDSTSSSVTDASGSSSHEFYVVKIYMETSQNHYGNHYKSILVTNNEHTKAVLHKILSKYMIEDNADDYTIFQILPDRELQIPDRGNVFYALDTSVDEMQFVVKKKSDMERLKKIHLRGKGRTKKYTL